MRTWPLIPAVVLLGCGDPTEPAPASTTDGVSSADPSATSEVGTPPGDDDVNLDTSTSMDGASSGDPGKGSSSGGQGDPTTDPTDPTDSTDPTDPTDPTGDDDCPTPGCTEYAAKMNECYDVGVNWFEECQYVYEVCGIIECLPGIAGTVSCVNTSSCDVIGDGGCNGLPETC